MTGDAQDVARRYPELAGRIAVVTGAARGIGAAIASTFAGAGMRVVGLDRQAEPGSSATMPGDGEVVPWAVDVGDEADVAAAMRRVRDDAGRLDVLVNNAAIADPETGPIETLELAAWQQRLQTNLTGAFLCTKHAVPLLRAGHGTVINIASTRAAQSEPHCEAYAASKAGLVGLTHALAISLGPQVRVNAISPGWIDTAGEADSLRAIDHAQHPAGRVGQPGDVAALAAWLASDAAAFVTGQDWTVDGGMTRRMIYAE